MKTLVTLLTLLMATAALAQDMKSLNGFVGSYKCTGTTFASEMGPEHPTTASVDVKSSFGGKWLEMHYTETRTAKNPMPIEAVNYWGWDASQKKYVATGVDNMGGHGTQTSAGMNGDAIVFEGSVQMGPTPATLRDTFTVKGNTATHTGAMKDAKGGWKKMDEETCKK